MQQRKSRTALKDGRQPSGRGEGRRRRRFLKQSRVLKAFQHTEESLPTADVFPGVGLCSFKAKIFNSTHVHYHHVWTAEEKTEPGRREEERATALGRQGQTAGSPRVLRGLSQNKQREVTGCQTGRRYVTQGNLGREGFSSNKISFLNFFSFIKFFYHEYVLQLKMF